MFNIHHLLDETKCFENLRQMPCPDVVTSPFCDSKAIINYGKDDTQPHRQRYLCKDCGMQFADLSCTILACHHQPLRTWMMCLYLMGLNLSSLQIGSELGIHRNVAQEMIKQFRQAIVDLQIPSQVDGEVECDEVLIVAGHKGHPETVKKGRTGCHRCLKSVRG